MRILPRELLGTPLREVAARLNSERPGGWEIHLEARRPSRFRPRGRP